MSEATTLSMEVHGRSVDTVFDLLGHDENDMTYSLGWVLANSPAFLTLFLKDVAGQPAGRREVHIRLQQYEPDSGITDIEIEEPGTNLIIVEAKKGWNLTSEGQPDLYAKRFDVKWAKPRDNRILVLSECSSEYAHLKLPDIVGDGIALRYVQWDTVRHLLRQARPSASNAQKRLMQELDDYLIGGKEMPRNESNLVYVVSLGAGKPEGWDISWRDIVRERDKYFHPVGRGYPKEPPNYIAFRYEGRMRAIHYVESAKMVPQPHEYFPEAPDGQKWDGPYFLYELGPAFGPGSPLPYGKQYRAGQLRCMLDTLFTCATLAEAVEVTHRRLSSEQGAA